MNEENPNNEKKIITFKNLLIKRILFIIIFAIIAGGITSYLVIKNRPTVNTNSNSDMLSQTPINDNEVPKNTGKNHISLINYDTDTFNYNDLKITEVIEENYKDYGGKSISYLQIDGLKDKSIQDKINYHLENDLKQALSQAKTNGYFKDEAISKGNCIIYSLPVSSFANTLSVHYQLFEIIDGNNSWSNYIPENYNLITGEQITFQDMFTDDTRGSDIFDNNFYNELIGWHTDTVHDEESDLGLRVTDYNDIEEKIFEFCLKFNSGENIPFYFDEQSIILTDFINAKLYYEDNLDFVAIYNRFKTSESIFDGKYNYLHNLPVLTKRDNTCDYQILEEEQNYYIDVNYLVEEKNVNEKILNSALNYINSDITEIKSHIGDNKFYIYNSFYTLYSNGEGTPYNILNIISYQKETSKSLFYSEIKPKILNVFRKVDKTSEEEHIYGNLFVKHLYDYNFNVSDDGWLAKEYKIYIDENGNIYETALEAINHGSTEIKD